MKNWKTTLAGVAIAVLNLVANGGSWKQILFSAGALVFGAVAKDNNVTGGTKQQ